MKQQAIEDFPVLQCQRAEFVRQSTTSCRALAGRAPQDHTPAGSEHRAGGSHQPLQVVAGSWFVPLFQLARSQQAQRAGRGIKQFP